MGQVLSDDANIGNEKVVLRRISDRSHVFDENLRRRRPSSDAFLQDGPDGLVSVYLESETTHEAVASGGPEPFLVSISVGELRKAGGELPNGLGIIRDPTSGGPGHCVITGRKTRGRLSQIAKQAQWVPGYAPPNVE
jgi:hypothetical protein